MPEDFWHNTLYNLKGWPIVDETVLRIECANKFFPGVHALNNVHFSLKRGEVHAILGENGAGKSTLIKVIAGVYKLDSGEIYFDGNKVNIADVNSSEKLGIRVIYQELALSENMTVADNIFMGREPVNRVGTVNYNKMLRESQIVLNKIDKGIKANAKVSSLSIAQKQVVEIAKALSTESKVIVMDEPTASLSKDEVDKLFETIETLRSQSVSIIYISHRMEELFRIADRVTILRDGQYIDTQEINTTTKEKLIKLMVGRELLDYYKRDIVDCDEIVLDVQNLCNKSLKDINLYIKKGEIVGIAGLVGAGRTEFANALFGIDPIISGKILLNGNEIKVRSPIDAIKKGIVLVPESRKDQGLVLVQTVSFNITLCILNMFIKHLRINAQSENKIVSKYIDQLKIKVASKKQRAINLSGGNQQKIVIAKWLATNPKVLILDEPTRGIDVGAKAEIYSIMNHLVKKGDAILMISSELPEIINMCDRVYVMNKGELKACLSRSEATQESICCAAIGVDENEIKY